MEWKHEILFSRVGWDIHPAANDVEDLGQALNDVLDEIESCGLGVIRAWVESKLMEVEQ